MPGRGLSFTVLFKPDVIIFLPRHNKGDAWKRPLLYNIIQT
jgi:hypothetical protein